MRLRPLHLTTLRDFYFLTVCAGIFVLMATCVLWIYATYFAPPLGKARRYAPEGTFFLRTYASVRTATGVVGVPCGECVHRINEKAPTGMMRVTDGKYSFDVFPYQLTDDLDVAEALSAGDGEMQRLLGQRAAADLNALQREKNARDEAHASDVAQISARYRGASIVGALQTPLNGPVTRRIGGESYSVPSYYGGSSTVNNNVSINRGGSSAGSSGSSSPEAAPTRYTEDPMSRLHRAASAGGAAPAPASW